MGQASLDRCQLVLFPQRLDEAIPREPPLRLPDDIQSRLKLERLRGEGSRPPRPARDSAAGDRQRDLAGSAHADSFRPGVGRDAARPVGFLLAGGTSHLPKGCWISFRSSGAVRVTATMPAKAFIRSGVGASMLNGRLRRDWLRSMTIEFRSRERNVLRSAIAVLNNPEPFRPAHGSGFR